MRKRSKKERLFRMLMLWVMLLGAIYFALNFMPSNLSVGNQIGVFFGWFFIARAWRGLTEYLVLRFFLKLKKPTREDINKIFHDKKDEQ